MNWINNNSISLMNKGLDGLWTRQRAISDNIANYETPNYKSKSVTFEGELKSQLEKTGQKRKELTAEIDKTSAVINQDNTKTIRADGNNVDIEFENTEMARTQLNYSYLTRQMTDHFSRLRHVISEGRK